MLPTPRSPGRLPRSKSCGRPFASLWSDCKVVGSSCVRGRFGANIVVESCESVARWFVSLLERELGEAVLQGEAMRRIYRILDDAKPGGAPLLGVCSGSCACHGRSLTNVIENAAHGVTA